MRSSNSFSRLMSPSVIVLLVAVLFSLSINASPLPESQDATKHEIDLGFKPLPDHKQVPIKGLPLKLYVHAGPNCRSERTHLYYLPERVCIGPLYHPAGSFKMFGNLPEQCVVKGFVEGHCKGDHVKINGLKPFRGPQPRNQCVNMDVPSEMGEDEVWEGVNSLVLDCGVH
ncbi:MAG: hypothetical protein MMC23_005478 [Stictis urceolatum]|nr:hypothetical protein [Stictis urceolata]